MLHLQLSLEGFRRFVLMSCLVRYIKGGGGGGLVDFTPAGVTDMRL